MSPRIILHIGQQKTGTTTLQRALVADRSRLLDAGILYPDVGHQRAPRSDASRPSHNGLFFALEGRHQPRSPAQMRTRLEHQISANAADVVLISAERAFLAADHRNRILDGLDRMAPWDKRVVVYLRRPDSYLTSYHKQLIRMGRKVAGLHTGQRLDELRLTCQLDHTRAVGLYAERYGGVDLFSYDEIDDTVTHFYESVLGLDAPVERPARTNPSIPSVFAELARQWVVSGSRLEPGQIRLLIAHGEREIVDLLGATNRRHLLEYYRPHDAYLGSLVGRDAFFEDLEDMAVVPPGSISVAEADRRYGDIFAALSSPPSVYRLRAVCLALEARAAHQAASQLLAAALRYLEPADVEWFRRDLEASSGGRLSIKNGRYVKTAAPASGGVETVGKTNGEHGA